MKKLLVNNNQLVKEAKGIRRYFDSLNNYIGKEFEVEFMFKNNNMNAAKRKAREQLYFLQNKKYDLMWSPAHASGPYWAKNHLVTVHDLIPLFPYSRISRMYRLYFKNSVALLMKNAKHVVCISASVADMVQIFYRVPSSRISIIRNGYNIAEPSKGASKPNLHGKYLLFVGTLSHHKNCESLIEAFLLNKKRGADDLNLVIAGHFPMSVSLGSIKIDFQGLKGAGVHFYDNPDDETLFQLYQNCHGVAMPSLNEGFGLPVVEALHYGKPVICSDIAVFRELFGGIARSFFDPYDLESIARAITLLSETSNRHTSLESLNYAKVSTWTWQMAAREYVKIFHLYM